MPKITRQQPPANTSKKSPAHGPSTIERRGLPILERIGPVSRSGLKDRINIYGASGSGKTTLACTYPKPILLIGAEDGTRSVRDVPDVDFVLLEHSSEIKDLFHLARSKRKYATVVLDTATSLQAMTLKEILGLEELPTQRNWGMATRDQYGQSALQTKEILRHLLRLAEDGIVHAIVLAQERVFGSDDEAEGSELIAPKIMSSLTASTVRWLNPECDYIVQTFLREKVNKLVTHVEGADPIEVELKTGEEEYCLRVRPHPLYLIKFRGPKRKDRPDAIVNPTYEKIQALITV